MYHDLSLSMPMPAGLRPGADISPVDSSQDLPSLRDQVKHLDGTGSLSVGRPIVFSAGQFSDCTIRMELNEIQKADLGRKYAQVDRRPLDPPPVVQLRIFKLQHTGTELEVEKEVDYGSVQVLGFICTVDLFPVPDSFAPSQPHAANGTSSDVCPTSPSPSSTSSSTLSLSCEEHSVSRSVHDLCPVSSVVKQNQSTDCSYDLFPSPAPTEIIVHRLGDYAISESAKRTQALSGATFVQAEKLEYQGKKAILFPFTDLAVKIEGVFILRYRVFDLFSHPHPQENTTVIGAETYGGPFRVYSTKEFPGLRVSTELTKSLYRWGVRVNVRETERRRKERF